MLYTKGITECNPSDVDYDEDRLNTLNDHFQSLVEDKEIYGATYCLSRRGKVFAHGAVGYKTYKREESLPVSPTDVQYIASMTKLYAGVAITKLVEDGKLSLATMIGEVLPQFKNPPFDKINVFHLLTHTSGMHPDGGCFPNDHNQGGYWQFIGTAYEAWKNDKSKKKGKFDWISASLAYGVRTEPDKEWLYCSFGFSILGAVIEKLTGVNSHDYIMDNIVKPLGLKDTGFDVTPDMAKRYMIQNKWSEKLVEGILNGKPEKHGKPWESIPSLGGGMSSTVWDNVRFGNMILHDGTFDGVRILGRKAVEKITDFAIRKPTYCWGAGGVLRDYAIGFDHRTGIEFSYSDSTVMHEGAGACALYIDPEEELVASWINPFVNQEVWCTKAMYNTINVIWSGLR